MLTITITILFHVFVYAGGAFLVLAAIPETGRYFTELPRKKRLQIVADILGVSPMHLPLAGLCRIAEESYGSTWPGVVYELQHGGGNVAEMLRASLERYLQDTVYDKSMPLDAWYRLIHEATLITLESVQEISYLSDACTQHNITFRIELPQAAWTTK